MSITASRFINDDPTERLFCPFKTAQDLTTLGTLDTTRLFVGNLSYNASEDDLEQAMSQCLTCGRLRSCVILRRQNGQSKGCGIIEFESLSEARHAIMSMQNSEIAGRPIFVREDREPAWRLDRLKKTRERRTRRMERTQTGSVSSSVSSSEPCNPSENISWRRSSSESLSSSPSSPQETYWSAGWPL